ncbi:PLD nuclease N-terminal domain-containing protein [Kurthia massiliensis]|uniref:PLD nuclease N-terminal domain-containing protein n=1 Tax=Kurthia massiliensis TaxID=1033739 RepID=UPI0002897492|nr:PLD nuclease N-terminal domain-containing protein [Kurthia massiliensis]
MTKKKPMTPAQKMVVIPLAIIQIVLMIVAIIDLVRNKAVNGPKFLWGIIVIGVNTFGPIAYFLFGRKKSQ